MIDIVNSILKAVFTGICFAVLFMLFFVRPAMSERDNYLAAGKQTVMLLNPDGSDSGGTGFVINTPSGAKFTMTNSHICRMAGETGSYIYASRGLKDQKQRLQIIAIDTAADLCVLTPMPGLSGLSLGEPLKLYDQIYVIGHPLLRPTTISRGYLIGHDAIDIYREDLPADKCNGPRLKKETVLSFFGEMEICLEEDDADWTDARTYPGNSGSPVVNERGQVVGVLFAGDRASNGFFVPLAAVTSFLSKL